MIKCKDGNVELKGKGYQLLTDLTLIVKALREEGCTEELLQKELQETKRLMNKNKE